MNVKGENRTRFYAENNNRKSISSEVKAFDTHILKENIWNIPFSSLLFSFLLLIPNLLSHCRYRSIARGRIPFEMKEKSLIQLQFLQGCYFIIVLFACVISFLVFYLYSITYILDVVFLLLMYTLVSCDLRIKHIKWKDFLCALHWRILRSDIHF